jgi:hypothetical protein
MKEAGKERPRDQEREDRRKQPGERSQEREARNVARWKNPCELGALKEQDRTATRERQNREAWKEQLGEKPGEGSKKKKTERIFQVSTCTSGKPGRFEIDYRTMQEHQ